MTAELELGEALDRLPEVPGRPPGASTTPGQSSPVDIAADIVAALAAIPNDNLPWKEWCDNALAIFAGTDGSDEGLDALIEWSKKCEEKFDKERTEASWEHFKKYPPNHTGAGKLFALAREAVPGWRSPSEQAADAEQEDILSDLIDPQPADLLPPPPPIVPGPGPSPTPQPQPAIAGVQLDDFYAYMVMGTFIYTPTRDPWPAKSVNARIPPIQVGIDKAGDPILISASAWLAQNRPVEQVSWCPGLPLLIPDRLISEGGWIPRDGVSVLNLYRPPLLIPGDPRKAAPWLRHVRRIYPLDADHSMPSTSPAGLPTGCSTPRTRSTTRWCSGGCRESARIR